MNKQIIAVLLCLSAIAGQAKPFPETWAYLMKGEEKYFPAQSPITDVGCFSAAVDGDGNLSGGHTSPPALPGANRGTRYHLVVTIPWSTTLAHIYLDPKLPFRQRIIDGIVERCGPFDGVQIDIESVSSTDGTNYLNFLAAVKKALPKGKLFSVAVMARWEEHKRKNPTDAFDYPFIGMIADRVVVMAYDEHYRGGSHGPIASLPWCRDIYAYALKTIPADKLVMGVPLYGRGWQTPSLAKAYKNREIVDELSKKGIKSTWTEDCGHYSFQQTVTINVHYETQQSLKAKYDLYAQRPIRGIACWRIGQEPEGFWNYLLQL
ncbi:Spore germination protein YaaH [Pontiella desulfatans]|uniref:Spore germination protein YaaH n=1 Tax=Pontiella desulfatans TaxID=2750659 RepID=A0A6C2TVG8_PONDE|nr:glycosyl hydrolase family 18 protein [Pontiella desulfatans]VGO11609.1 Spore germination protein YaaH [Pontiella desulfatans]